MDLIELPRLFTITRRNSDVVDLLPWQVIGIVTTRSRDPRATGGPQSTVIVGDFAASPSLSSRIDAIGNREELVGRWQESLASWVGVLGQAIARGMPQGSGGESHAEHDPSAAADDVRGARARPGR